jgi:calcium-dependent protein kinase
MSGESSVIGNDTQRILSMVRHVRPQSQALGNARMVSHIDLWDEYCYGPEKQVLGEGLNGPVVKIFSRRDPNLSYALKEIKTSSGGSGPSSSALMGLVLNELEVILQLDHYHIARVFEVYESSTSVFLVTELCTGGELYGKLEQVKKFNEIESIFLLSQILKAMNYMHSLEIIHGDLKLENFLFSNKEGVLKSPLKLIDFGFSHRASGKNSSSPKSLLCGSPLYMAPEKLMDRSETTKSDMWSVGIIAFMLLTGKSPFKAVKNMNQMRDYFASEFNNISNLIRTSLDKVFSISADGVDFISKLLDTNPETRMSARDALGHKWLSGMQVRRTHSRMTVVDDLKNCSMLLIEFSRLGPLRRAAIGLIAMYAPPLVTLKAAPALFDAIDSNNDGFIQINELEVFCPDQTLEIFNAVDLVGDGRINFSEFIAATDIFCTIKQSETLPIAYEAIIESIFRKLDVDNSGVISEHNLLSLFGNRGYKGARSRELIREGDFVGDGVISLDEFFALICHGKDEKKL